MPARAPERTTPPVPRPASRAAAPQVGRGAAAAMSRAPSTVRTSVTHTAIPLSRKASTSRSRFSSSLATTKSGRSDTMRSRCGFLVPRTRTTSRWRMGAPVGGTHQDAWGARRDRLGERRHKADHPRRAPRQDAVCPQIVAHRLPGDPRSVSVLLRPHHAERLAVWARDEGDASPFDVVGRRDHGPTVLGAVATAASVSATEKVTAQCGGAPPLATPIPPTGRCPSRVRAAYCVSPLDMSEYW